jgi:hypothetical protein
LPALQRLAARERGRVGDGVQDALVALRDATVGLALLEGERCNLRGERNKSEGKAGEFELHGGVMCFSLPR